MTCWSLTLEPVGPLWTWFEADHYARYDATAASAAGDSVHAALIDFQDRGAALNYAPNPLFDPVFYLQSYPDVADQVAAGKYSSAFGHYSDAGWRDRDPHWLFSALRYMARYGDLTPDLLAPLGGPYGHYLSSGAAEGRIAHPLFDPDWYRSQVAEAPNPFQHFLVQLKLAGAVPEPSGSPYFDPLWYMATYQDVAAAVAGGQMSALEHYVVTGAREGRDPSAHFSEQYYRSTNADIDRAVRDGDCSNGFEHFLDVGAIELRAPCSQVDLRCYAALPSVAADLASGRAGNAYQHLLAIGSPETLPLTETLSARDV